MFITQGDVRLFLDWALKMSVDGRFDIWEVGKAAGYDHDTTLALSNKADEWGCIKSTDTSGGAIILKTHLGS